LQPFDILRAVSAAKRGIERLETERGMLAQRVRGREVMEYDLKAMDLEIKAIEERTKRLRELGNGFQAVERNADSILTFVFLLKKNISDLVE
jgi:hypothetical protein